MVSVLELAKYILKTYTTKLNNLVLNKIIYFVVLDYYKNHKVFLIKEDFVAGIWGPLILEVYNHYKTYGSKDLDIPTDSPSFDDDINIETINESLDHLVNLRNYELIENSRRQDGAWCKTISDACFDKNSVSQLLRDIVIDRKLIEEEAERYGKEF